MDNVLKFAIGFVAVALVIGISGVPAMANSRLGIMGVGGGMMGAGFGTGGMMNAGFMQSMMGNAGFRNMMNGNFDMNQMHRTMHGTDTDVDMNQMHSRMLAGNLTSDDLNEMREHCPMMG